MELAYLLFHGLVNFKAWHFFQNSGTVASESIVLPWIKTTVVPQWGSVVKKLWKRNLRKGQREETITDAKKKIEIRELDLLLEIISAIICSRKNIFNTTARIFCLTVLVFIVTFCDCYCGRVYGCWECTGWGVLSRQLACIPEAAALQLHHMIQNSALSAAALNNFSFWLVCKTPFAPGKLTLVQADVNLLESLERKIIPMRFGLRAKLI